MKATWIKGILSEDLAREIINYLLKTYFPGWKLIPPGYHKHKNPVTKKKAKLVWKESTLEDARDMAIEIAQQRRAENE